MRRGIEADGERNVLAADGLALMQSYLFAPWLALPWHLTSRPENALGRRVHHRER